MHQFELPCAPHSERLERKWAKKRGIDTDDWLRREEPISLARRLIIRAPKQTRNIASAALEAEIKRARQEILNLPNNWDEAGASTIDRNTWEKAERFLRNTASDVFQQRGSQMPVPQILPSPDGSIDILWKNERFKLLINIFPQEKAEADFYGKTSTGLEIKGKFFPEVHHKGILSWLVDNG